MPARLEQITEGLGELDWIPSALTHIAVRARYDQVAEFMRPAFGERQAMIDMP